jgi:hypothetical protein
MAEREFTLTEARDTLELIRGRVEELRGTQTELRAVKQELSELNRRHLNNGRVGDAELRNVQIRQRQLGEAASELVRSIHESGAVIKGIDDGLIDFPATIDGIESYWCWKAGEVAIDWWHPRGTGFADRRPIAELPPGTIGA